MSIRLRQSATAAPDAIERSDRQVAGEAALRLRVAIIIPCFNEREALPQLFERMAIVEAGFAGQADLQWCFVDDGSTDGTWAALREHIEPKPNTILVRHSVNRGLSAAILSGVSHTDAPIICCMDADCTYDPAQLPAMVARAEDGVAAVTASPYHPDGGVAGVAAWRLWLSKLASSFYRVLSQNKLHTYTSCFRVYRREAVADIHLRYRRFAGVAEILWHLDRAGGKVVEYPIVLHCRQVGQSKLRVVPVMLEHLRLLTRCAWERLFTAGKPVFRPTTSNLSDCRSHARAPARDAPPAASAEIIEL